MSDTLGDALARELERCRELLVEYGKIPSGEFASIQLRELFGRADKAMIEAELPSMLGVLQELKACR